jgi:hypothetical protein
MKTMFGRVGWIGAADPDGIHRTQTIDAAARSHAPRDAFNVSMVGPGPAADAW